MNDVLGGDQHAHFHAGGYHQRVIDRQQVVRHRGWIDVGAELARAYAEADIFLFPSATDTFGQVILEAQASGLAVVAVAEGGPLSLIEDGVSGLLRPAQAPALAEAVLELARSPERRAALSQAAVRRARMRTWERTMELLAAGYTLALESTADAALAWAAAATSILR